MDVTYLSLQAALEERLETIADRDTYTQDPESHLKRLQSVSERITELAGQLPTPVDPRLQHYLERHSYDKALDFIRSLRT